jgi:hypothetical protein
MKGRGIESRESEETGSQILYIMVEDRKLVAHGSAQRFCRTRVL